ncbi:2Fe-2S iron-sulfur cluster-binding protein [Piscinibacter sakaiensis]|uniref:2Fe-2S iron-sulfur cluster-binding protein n=1 Tax=Piscinibacter sakaiensis TaxID=1547922 RepID=UPI0037276C62
MPDITLIEADGREHAFEAPDGVSLMHAAVGWGVDGLVGECGGGLRCATCHVVVDPAWQERVGPPTAGEAAMLAFTACPAEPGAQRRAHRAAARLDAQVELHRRRSIEAAGRPQPFHHLGLVEAQLRAAALAVASRPGQRDGLRRGPAARSA